MSQNNWQIKSTNNLYKRSTQQRSWCDSTMSGRGSALLKTRLRAKILCSIVCKNMAEKAHCVDKLRTQFNLEQKKFCVGIKLWRLNLNLGYSHSFIIHHSLFIIHHSSFIIYHLSFIIYHLSFIIHHLSFIIHHSSFINHQSSQTTRQLPHYSRIFTSYLVLVPQTLCPHGLSSSI